MSLTIRANQGNAIAADNAGIKKNESAEQIKKRNVVDARTLMIGNTTDEKINQKKNSVRNQAMKLIRDAWKSDNDSVDSRKEMEDARAQALEEVRDYESKANDIEKQKKQLMEEYGIDPDSDEKKDLELLEKYQKLVPTINPHSCLLLRNQRGRVNWPKSSQITKAFLQLLRARSMRSTTVLWNLGCKLWTLSKASCRSLDHKSPKTVRLSNT